MRIARPPLKSFALLTAGLFAIGSAAGDTPLSHTEQILWTTSTITLYDNANKKVLEATFDRLREINDRMSVNTPGSELDPVAAAAGRAPVPVTDDVLLVTRKALQLAELSHGLFDPTVGPLIKVWQINKAHPDVPKAADIAHARALVNWRDVVVDANAKTIFLRRSGMELDLGALVKGYAADEAARILSASGVRSAIIDLGGDIFALGRAPNGQPWRIGVQNPDAQRGAYLGIAKVIGKTVVTSGVYEHYFIKDGKRYHHIMDTRTGYPVDNGLESVTVITKSSMDADGLGLALFCMGKTGGIELGKRLGLGVIMVDSSHKVYVMPGTKQLFTVTDNDFTCAN
ncbi:MAG: FAD:protein FMN transferase [Spirochaetia bacterium]|jgi:thiamine biosynthesis lipoprotein